jgi:hypothetical protein
MSDAQAPDTNHDPAALEVSPAAAPAPEAVVPHAGLRYAALRVLMFVTVGGVLYVIGLRSWLLLFAAVLLSGIASWFVLTRQREAAARNLEASVEHWNDRRHHHEQGSAGSVDQLDGPAAAPDREPAEG